MAVDTARLEVLCRELLLAIGEDPDRAGLAETPARWARMWQEFLAAGTQPHSRLTTTFPAESADQMIVVSGIRVWTMCEHHLLPFWCDLAIGYVAGARILGLSKFARIAGAAAGRLQVQERLVTDIHRAVCEATDTEDVAVLAVGEHLCMTMRGVKTPHRMTSSMLGGCYKAEGPARAEFLRLARGE